MVHAAIPQNAEQPNLLNGLVQKRAEIAGRIEAGQDELRKLITDLNVVEATIRVFDPNVDLEAVNPRPVPPRLAAYNGEVARMVFIALRAATEPMASAEITALFMKERGLSMDDKELVRLMTTRVGACLRTQKIRGVIRSLQRPGKHLGWELIR